MSDELKKETITEVKRLIQKAGSADKSDDALKYSQAACNVSHSYSALFYINK